MCLGCCGWSRRYCIWRVLRVGRVKSRFTYTSTLTMTVTMRRLFALAVYLFAFIVGTLARSSTGNSVLVVLEKDLPKDEFSTFFSGLEGTCVSCDGILNIRSDYHSRARLRAYVS